MIARASSRGLLLLLRHSILLSPLTSPQTSCRLGQSLLQPPLHLRPLPRRDRVHHACRARTRRASPCARAARPRARRRSARSRAATSGSCASVFSCTRSAPSSSNACSSRRSLHSVFAARALPRAPEPRPPDLEPAVLAPDVEVARRADRPVAAAPDRHDRERNRRAVLRHLVRGADEVERVLDAHERSPRHVPPDLRVAPRFREVLRVPLRRAVRGGPTVPSTSTRARPSIGPASRRHGYHAIGATARRRGPSDQVMPARVIQVAARRNVREDQSPQR